MATIPVWLITGHLGSGKTTLLRRWLGEPALASAALVINELGEVGFDDRMLSSASDRASLLAGACVCCEGMPGLEEALLEMWWDRLHRRRPRFDAVVIETTGAADPAPLVAAFGDPDALGRRYRLEGVVATLSATAGLALLDLHDEVRSQVAAADLLVVTKADRADATRASAALRRLNPRAAIATSAQASLSWAEAARTMRARSGAIDTGGDTSESGGDRAHRAPHAAPPDHAAEGYERHSHAGAHHHLDAAFIALPGPLSVAQLHRLIDGLGTGLLRVKGVVRLQDGSLQAIQWSPGDAAAQLEPFFGDPPQLGLTRIRG